MLDTARGTPVLSCIVEVHGTTLYRIPQLYRTLCPIHSFRGIAEEEEEEEEDTNIVDFWDQVLLLVGGFCLKLPSAQQILEHHPLIQILSLSPSY